MSAADHLSEGQFPGAAESMDLYHRTSTESAAQIRESGRFTSKEYDRSVYFSTSPGHGDDSQTSGYGDEVVHVRVPGDLAELDDEFPSGEQHYRIDARRLRREHIQP